LLKLERVKDYLLMEEEFIQNQERLKPQEEKSQVRSARTTSIDQKNGEGVERERGRVGGKRHVSR